jgi:hypothetical protein
MIPEKLFLNGQFAAGEAALTSSAFNNEWIS